MLAIIGLFFAFVIIAGWVLPWVNRSGLKELEQDVRGLHTRVSQMERQARQASQTKQEAPPQEETAKPENKTALPPAPVIPPASPVPPLQTPAAKTSVPVSKAHDTEDTERKIDAPAPQKTAAAHTRNMPSTAAPAPVAAESGFELQFGARLPVWFGGIALAFAGFYLVKYSIDVGLLTPAVRTFIGAIFGLGLLTAGKTVRSKENFANGVRIAQALTGAGIAVLYVCTFAAANMYDLITPLTGFICMGVVTAAAVILSLRHGAPIALLGMMGGFLTPALMETSQPSALLLFGYLYFVLAGLLFVIRRQGWWHMGYLAVAGAFVWAILWLLAGNFGSHDGTWLGLFLMACTATLLGNPAAPCAGNGNTGNPGLRTAPRGLQIASFTGTLILMGATVSKAGFGMMEWGMFGLLSAAGMALAYFRMQEYRFIPFATLALNIVMLCLWQPVNMDSFILVFICFSVLHVLGAYLLQWKTAKPFYWASLCVAASFAFLLAGYGRLHGLLHIEHLWSVIALALAAAATQMTWHVYQRFNIDHPERNKMLALYAGAASGLIALGLVIEVPYEILSVAIALELLALGWIYTRIDMPGLRRIIALVAAGFALLLVPQMIAMMQISAWALLEQKIYGARSLPLVDWPLFQLGIPATCFAITAVLLRRRADSKMVRIFEVTAIALLGLAGYYLTRHLMHPGENILFVTAGFGERGVITNVIFAFGLSCVAFGRKFGRDAVIASGLTLAGLALFRVGYFDLLIHNPLWNRSQSVGETPVFNWLLVTYGMPMVLSGVLVRMAMSLQKTTTLRLARIAMFTLAFALLSFEVRQFFHGAILKGGAVPDAEIYAYSAVWLIFGLLLLFYGVWRKLPLVRKASLAVVILVVGKVFLYDAAALTGLYRVAAFFGLGVSLLGISWFYTRFVFPQPRGVRAA